VDRAFAMILRDERDRATKRLQIYVDSTPAVDLDVSLDATESLLPPRN